MKFRWILVGAGKEEWAKWIEFTDFAKSVYRRWRDSEPDTGAQLLEFWITRTSQKGPHLERARWILIAIQEGWFNASDEKAYVHMRPDEWFAEYERLTQVFDEDEEDRRKTQFMIDKSRGGTPYQYNVQSTLQWAIKRYTGQTLDLDGTWTV